MFGTDIYDGQRAIHANFFSAITVQDNNFINNYIGIEVGSKLPSNIIGIVFQPDVLEGNSFETEGNGLKQPFSNQLGLCGVKLDRVYGFRVGTTNMGAGPNIFTRLRIGILAQTSTLNVHNSDFSNIVFGGSVPPNIPFGSGTSIGTLRSIGDLITDSRFINTSLAITHREFRSAEVEDCTMFDPVRLGILSQFSNDAQLIIRENDITSFRVPIWANLLNGQGELDISDQLGINRVPGPVYQWPAILFRDCHLDKDMAIIEFNSIISSDNQNAISVRGCSGLTIQNNNIDIVGGPGPFGAVGILTGGSSDIDVIDNDVTGTNSNIFTTGIQVGENFGVALDHVRFCCNTMINTNTGLEVGGLCTFTDIKGTNLGDHEIGLLYTENAIINAQIDNGNLWTGTYSDVGARHEGLVESIIENSRYDVDFSGSGLPSSIDVVNFPNEPWFYPSANTPFDCTLSAGGCDIVMSETPRIDALVTSVVTGNLQIESALIWQAERSVFRKIGETPDWLQDSAVSAFYTAKQGTPVDLFNDIEDRIKALKDVSPTEMQQYKTNQDGIQSRLRLLMQKDSLLWDANPADSTNLVAEIAAVNMELLNLGIENDSLYNIVLTGRISNIQGIISDNNAIATTTIYEQNQKTVNDIWLRTVSQNNFELTAAQLSTLDTIVNQCPLTGGKAVLTARGLYQMETDTLFNDADYCTPPQNLVFEEGDKSSIGKYLFPNPANYSVTLQLEETFETDSEIILTDLNGRIAARYTVSPETTQYRFSVEDLPEGFYLCRFTNGNQIIFSEKLIVTH